WFLTDDPSNLAKWRFPSQELAPGDGVIIFASGKDRPVAGKELHTNFKLHGDGGYLAIVTPDGRTVAHEYSPASPPQHSDVSYGIAQAVTVAALVPAGASGKALIPLDESLGLDWTRLTFNDGAWLPARMGVGYDTEDKDPGGNGNPPGELVNLALSGTATQSS